LKVSSSFSVNDSNIVSAAKLLYFQGKYFGRLV
jgi:hypothetical protein